MANGISTTTIRKNSTPMQRAAADAHGEPHVADEEGREAGSCRRLPAAAPCAPVEPDRPVRRRHDQPAAGEVLPHQPGERAWRLAVERRGRLVEQPERPLDGQQAGDATAAAAARPTGRRRAGRPEPQARRGQSAVRTGSRAAEIARPESQVFGDRQRRLQRVLVAEIMGLFGDGQLGVARRRAPAGRRRSGPARRSSAAARICRRRCGR